MQLVKHRLKPNHQIYLVGDTHEGNENKAEDSYHGVLKQIAKERNSYLCHMGDAIDAIASDDKRYHHEHVNRNTPTPLLQAQAVVDELRPVKDKILVALEGNHEDKLHRFGNLTRDVICRELEIPYGTYQCRLSIADERGRVKYKMFLTHGAGSLPKGAKDKLQRKSNQMAALKRKLEKHGADCVLAAMGHTHQLHVYDARQDPELHIVDDGNKLKQIYLRDFRHGGVIHPDYRIYCNTGSFLKTSGKLGSSGYAERLLLEPNELGYVKVVVRNYQIVEALEVVV